MRIEIDAPDHNGYEFELMGYPNQKENDDLFFFDALGRAMPCDGSDIGLCLLLYRKSAPPEPEFRVFVVCGIGDDLHKINDDSGKSQGWYREVTDKVSVLPKGQEGPTREQIEAEIRHAFGAKPRSIEASTTRAIERLFQKEEPSDD